MQTSHTAIHPFVVHNKSIFHLLQECKDQEDSLVVRSSELPGTVGILVVVVGVVRAGDSARAKQMTSAGTY